MKNRRLATLVSLGTAALVLGGVFAIVAPNAVSASAPDPTEVAVIPADTPATLLADRIVFAGATGFAHQATASSQLYWTTYEDGKTVPATPAPRTGMIAAGGDGVSSRLTTTTAERFDYATGTTTTFTVPAGFTIENIYGNSVIGYTKPGGVLVSQVLRFTPDGSSFTTVPVTGPTGVRVALGYVGDTAAAVVRYTYTTAQNVAANALGLLDLATGVVAPMNSATFTCRPYLTPDRIVDLCPTGFEVFSRAGVADGSANTPTVVPFTMPAGASQIAVAGDRIIVFVTGSPYGSVLAVPLDGSTPATVVAKASTTLGFASATDGSAVVVGGTGPTDWAVRRFADSGDPTTLLSLHDVTNAGLTIAQGVVHHIEAVGSDGAGTAAYTIYHHAVDPAAGTIPRFPSDSLTTPLACATGITCVRDIASTTSNDYYVVANSATSDSVREQAGGSYSSVSLGSATATIGDASPNYMIVNGHSPDQQYLVATNGYTYATKFGAPGVASVWFDRVWKPSRPGVVAWQDLDPTGTGPLTGKFNGGEIRVGSYCPLTDLQAVDQWVYWSCGGNGASGVYGLRTHVNLTLPSGPGLIGDGYFVQHDAASGELRMYDFHTGTVAAPVTEATVPGGALTDDRNVTWSVDRFSGDIAYVAGDDSVHVIDPGVVKSGPAVRVSTTYANFIESGDASYGTFQMTVATNGPISGATFQIHRKIGNAVVYTQTDGPSTTGASLSWNGLLSTGARALSGFYTVSMTITPVGSSTPIPASLPTGTDRPGEPFYIDCGALAFNAMDCLGSPAILGVGSTGQSNWFSVDLQGHLYNNGYTDNWQLGKTSSTVSTIIRFGDINNDRNTDLLVRTGTGVLQVYYGTGSVGYGGIGQPWKAIKTIGSGWNAYTGFAAPGDLTGDGRADLVARDSSGRLWLFAGTGKSSFAARVELTSGWSGYAKMLGAGDLTGDGHADLLAIDKSGVMWRFNGTGAGHIAGRVSIGGGWSGYNTVLAVGDWNQDGFNDLVARDSAGTLWLFPGTGKGTFGARKQISTGWSKWKALF